jgi:putative DNA primase/helicase
LPELVKAAATGETIYVPEGEKDVDNLRAIGFAATTNPGGCKKWRSEYSEHLRGADVVVLPDNHLEGREHGDQVAASLRGIASRIRVLDIGKHWAECPDKGDISDWLAAGGSAEKLKAIVDALPEAPTSADNPISGLAQAAYLSSRRAADITPRRIDFLWAGRLARGKHTAFAGEPGDYVAATISRGGEWPCNEGRAPLGNVIIFNAEDGADDTIVPRLIAAGADRERIHIVSAVLLEDGKGRRTFNLQADLALLEKKIREIGDVALVIIDPISSYMGKTDSHKNSEVRGALEPLSEMADRMKVAVLSITHFSKAGSGNTNKALHRFIGSIAFVGAPRAAFAVIEDADNEGRILFLHAKNNMAPKPQGLAYRLLQTIVCDDIVASYVHWESTPVTISADQALGAAESTGSRTTKEEATDFLRDILGQGEMPAEEVQQAARKAGITPKPLRSAREALKVKSRREGFGPGAVWYWSLPSGPLMPSPPIDAQPRDRASMDPEGIYGSKEDAGLPPKARLREPGQRVNAVNGMEHGEPTATVPPDDGLDVPEGLVRTGHRCDKCGSQFGNMSRWKWSGRPDGIWLHPQCEEAWHDQMTARVDNPTYEL